MALTVALGIGGCGGEADMAGPLEDTATSGDDTPEPEPEARDATPALRMVVSRVRANPTIADGEIDARIDLIEVDTDGTAASTPLDADLTVPVEPLELPAVFSAEDGHLAAVVTHTRGPRVRTWQLGASIDDPIGERVSLAVGDLEDVWTPSRAQRIEGGWLSINDRGVDRIDDDGTVVGLVSLASSIVVDSAGRFVVSVEDGEHRLAVTDVATGARTVVHDDDDSILRSVSVARDAARVMYTAHGAQAARSAVFVVDVGSSGPTAPTIVAEDTIALFVDLAADGNAFTYTARSYLPTVTRTYYGAFEADTVSSTFLGGETLATHWMEDGARLSLLWTTNTTSVLEVFDRATSQRDEADLGDAQPFGYLTQECGGGLVLEGAEGVWWTDMSRPPISIGTTFGTVACADDGTAMAFSSLVGDDAHVRRMTAKGPGAPEPLAVGVDETVSGVAKLEHSGAFVYRGCVGRGSELGCDGSLRVWSPDAAETIVVLEDTQVPHPSDVVGVALP